MKIYLVRHGQTDWNAQHKAQGRTDIPLNQVGVQQAKTLQNDIASLSFNAIYTLPLQRAIKTAQIATNYQQPIICDDRLIEQSSPTVKLSAASIITSLATTVIQFGLALDIIMPKPEHTNYYSPHYPPLLSKNTML